jgi:K+-transporting ATPase ATPase C chain
LKNLTASLKLFLFLTVLTGIIYPLLITGLAQVLFHSKANGSIIVVDGEVVGSKLIGQRFDSIIYFASRPSAIDYNPLPSGGSNLGITSSKLLEQVVVRKNRFIQWNKLDSIAEIPSEMLFASGSGLDPHISKKSAILQVDRIAEARNFDTVQKQNLVDCINLLAEKPQFLILGEERVNVLLLNLELRNLE